VSKGIVRVSESEALRVKGSLKNSCAAEVAIPSLRRHQLAEFAMLFRRSAHVLANEPGQLEQQACYQPESSGPALEAAQRSAAGLNKRPWLQLLTRPALNDPLVMTLLGHQKEVSDCCYSPDGRRILSSSWDGTLRLWDTATGELLAVLEGHAAWVLACCFSPDGRRIVSASDDECKVWDATTGRQTVALFRRGAHFEDCVVSPDGTEVVTGSADRMLRLWRLDDGSLRWSAAGHGDRVRAAAFSPDGNRIATAGSDRTVRIWDRDTGTLLRVLQGHRDQVLDCAFSPDGTLLVSAGGLDDKTVKLWAVEPPRRRWWRLRKDPPLRTLRGHQGLVMACAFSPDGALIASASGDRTVRLWSVRDGSTLAVLTGYRDDVLACAFSPDGGELVTGCRDHTIKVWNVRAALDSRGAAHAEAVLCCAVSPDRRTAATGAKDCTLSLWNVATGERIRTLKRRAFWIDCCAFSPDGRHLVAGSWKRIRLWDLATGAPRFTRSGHYWHAEACAFSPDGRWIASGDEAARLFLWDAARGTRIARLGGSRERARMSGIAFAPDGSAVACTQTAYADEAVSLWGLDPVELLARFSVEAHGCDFSPDGRTLMVWKPDGISLLNLSNGTAARRISAPAGDRLLTCRFSPCGDFLLGAFQSGALHIWDLAQARPAIRLLGIRALGGSGLWGGAAGCSDDGRVLAVGTDRGEVLLYRLMGVTWGIPIVTPVRLFEVATSSWAHALTASCPGCGERFQPQSALLEVIGRRPAPCWTLPDSAWEDSALISTCPTCRAPLRFNPFIVDNRHL
jgi:WD40 repeat protein